MIRCVPARVPKPITFAVFLAMTCCLGTPMGLRADPISGAGPPNPFDLRDRLLAPETLSADIETGIPGLPSLLQDAAKDAIPIYESLLKMLGGSFLGQPHLARGYHFLAGLYALMGDAENAEERYLRALELIEEHPDEALDAGGIANNLGLFYLASNRLDEAERYFRKALDLLGDITPAEGVYAAIAQQNLASVRHVLGDYGSAEQWYWKALDHLEAAGSNDREKEAKIRGNLALVYFSLGELAKAEELFSRLLDHRSLHGSARPAAMNNLAEIFRRRGEHGKAEKLLRKAAESFPAESEGRALALGNLGMVYLETRDIDRAREFIAKSLQLRIRLEGTSSMHVALMRFNLATAEHAAGRISSARHELEEALRIWRQQLPPNHPAVAGALENQALLLQETGDTEEALRVAREAQQRKQSGFATVLSYATESQRLAYLEQSAPYDLLANFATGPAEVSLLAEAVLRAKGLVLDSLIEERRLARLRRDPAADARVARLDALRRELMETTLSPLRDAAEEPDLESLRRQIAEAERALADLVRDMGRTRNALDTDLGDVRAALAPDQILVELVRYEHHLGRGVLEPHYGALLIAAGSAPEWQPLGPARDIDGLIRTVRSWMRCGDEDRGTHPLYPTNPCGEGDPELAQRLRQLYRQLWAPLEERLPAAIRRVIVSPDATLNFLPFAVLLDEQDRFLIERYELSYVTSGRDLLSHDDAPPEPSLRIYARPDYGTREASDNPVRLRFEDLPFTSQEAEELRRLAGERGWRVEVVEGENAREASLRTIDRSPGILHLATHGVILPAEPGDQGVLDRFASNPMHRGFLALAGAQSTLGRWDRGEPVSTEDDGILTAEEIGGLDLAGVWLAVISTCDSGLGEARAGEGVLGLRRGFALAGARNLLISLWPVDDRRAVEFMSDFYRRLLSTRDLVGAINTVQRRQLLRIRGEASLSAAVRIAGAFVLSGAATSRPDSQGDTPSALREAFRAGARALEEGRFEHAAKYLERALSQGRDPSTTDDEENLARIRVYATGMLAIVYDLLGLEEKSSRSIDEARALAREGRSPEAAEVLRHLLRAHQHSQQDTAAAPLLESLGDLLEELGPALSDFDPGRMRPIFLFHQAQREFASGRFLEAVPLLEEARAAFRAQGSRDLEILALALLASAYGSAHEPDRAPRFDLALPFALEAVELFEEIVGDTRIKRHLRGLLGNERQTLYELTISLLILNGRAQDAFLYSEKARSRELQRLLGRRRPGAASGGDPEWVEEIGPESTDLETLRRDLLDEDTALVSYFVYPEWLLVWVLDGKSGARAVLPMSEQVWEDVRCQTDRLIAPPGASKARAPIPLHAHEPPECPTPDDPAAYLHDRLIAPIEQFFRDKRHLILVPHDFLHHVPFAALRNRASGRYLIRDYVLSLAPSAHVLRLLQENHPGRERTRPPVGSNSGELLGKGSPAESRVLILGDPPSVLGPLPAASFEAKRVGEIFGADPLLGDCATETALRSHARSVDLLHIAAHGVFEPEAPDSSRLLLASEAESTSDTRRDGRLDMREIFDELDLSGVDLVVLSACQTARGQRTGGDEILGLTRAFLHAGSSAVISTLWRIDDSASAELMISFYSHLRAGDTAAEALRKAQRSLLDDPLYSAPYFWAAFTLTGDHRMRWVS